MAIGGRFIGVGVTTATGAADELPAAVSDVEQFRTALADHYDGLIHPDPDGSAAEGCLRICDGEARVGTSSDDGQQTRPRAYSSGLKR